MHRGALGAVAVNAAVVLAWPVWRVLAAATFLLLGPAAGAQEAPPPSPPPEPEAVAPQAVAPQQAADLGAEALAQARALLDAGRFEEAVVLLRPLACEDVVLAEVLFLLGLAAIEVAPGRFHGLSGGGPRFGARATPGHSALLRIPFP